MTFFPYQTISEFFEAEGDFEENLRPDLDDAVLVGYMESVEAEDDARILEPNAAWFINEDGGVYPYDRDAQEDDFPNDDHLPYATAAEARAASDLMYPDDPCCYNSSRNFGTGEHEYGCPNY